LRDLLAILLVQCGLGSLGAVLALAVSGGTAGLVAMLGAAVCVLPSAFLAVRLLLCQDPEQLLRAAWLGEIGKLGLTVVLLIVALTSVEAARTQPIWLLTGFISAQFGALVGLLLPAGKRKA
jgi:F0F1-type ATP synthase assembly protein I